MAANLLPIQPLGVTASVPRSSENLRRRSSTVVAAANGGASWWSPLFGWSNDADYIESNSSSNESSNNSKENQDPIKSEKKSARSKFAGCLTEEKARQLRMMTMETETFHEVMYHSAIAARLATDFPRRSAQ